MMEDTESRLLDLFKQVRPDLAPETIRELTQSEMKHWDSIVLVTLFTLIEDEFKEKIEVKDYERLASFKELLKQVSP